MALYPYFWLVLLLITLFGFPDCRPSDRIIGGQPVSIEQFPSVAAILQYDGDEGTLTFICGGVILTSYFILTAGSYVHVENLKVRVGSDYWSSGGRLFDVIRTTIHPDYAWGVDLAVLGLNEPILFNDPSVAQGPLPFQDMEPLAGMTAFVVGWGNTELGGNSSENLHFGQQVITSRSECADIYANYRPEYISEKHICAMGPGVDYCYEDIGGPLYSAGLVVGIATNTADCGYTPLPNVYMHVARYLAWIQEVATGPSYYS